MWWLFRNASSGLALTGPRIVLRPPRARDADAWVALRRQSRDFLKPWEPTWPPDGASRAAFRRRHAQIRDEWRSNTGYGFLIFDHVQGVLVGGITLSNIRYGVSRTASLGYWTGAPFARQGYMTEAVACILNHAFGQLDLHRVEAACLPHNAASRGLLLKCGFREEGLARGYLKIDGRWQDHALFAILREDERPGGSR
ncbi:MAG: GNAT family N-acetyltransferase [Rhodospirillales bacterium]|nr:MAG: GNAT family N-acetyltransferase [Rhodospirillales bacterium]